MALELELEDSDDDEEASAKMPVEKRELVKVQSLQQVKSLLWFRVFQSSSNSVGISWGLSKLTSWVYFVGAAGAFGKATGTQGIFSAIYYRRTCPSTRQT